MPEKTPTETAKIIRIGDFTGSEAWESLPIANMNGITTKLHWTDEPYVWHVNDGQEVFAVLSGSVEMHYKQGGTEKIVKLETGDIFFADIGCEHVAKPIGEAKILVIEKDGSI